jgi:hypothetical protein
LEGNLYKPVDKTFMTVNNKVSKLKILTILVIVLVQSCQIIKNNQSDLVLETKVISASVDSAFSTNELPLEDFIDQFEPNYIYVHVNEKYKDIEISSNYKVIVKTDTVGFGRLMLKNGLKKMAFLDVKIRDDKNYMDADVSQVWTFLNKTETDNLWFEQGYILTYNKEKGAFEPVLFGWIN